MRSFLALSLIISTAGCGAKAETKATGQVAGKVTFKGQPVTFGTVMFSPIPKDEKDKLPGKAATGEVGQDGTFKLNTYVEGDGAILGKHKVSVGSPDPAKKLPGKSQENLVVEVKPGENPVEIQLVP